MAEISDNEATVLATFLHNPNLSLNYALPPQIFSSVVHENIFRNVQQIAKEIKNPNFYVIISELNSKGLLEVCGGAEYLNYLNSLSTEEEYLDVLLKNIIDAYKKRRFLSYIQNFHQADFPTANVSDILDKVIDEITNIRLLNSSDKVIPMPEATERAFLALEEKLENKNIITSGYLHLDAVTGGLHAGDLWYIAGRPSMGKTAWCINAINRQIEKGLPVLLISLEMRLEALIYRLFSVRTGIPLLKLKLGVLTKKELETLKEEKEKLRSLSLFIDDNFNSDIHYITSIINRQVQKNRIKIVHIDYIQLISVKNQDNSVRAYTDISRELKILANKLGISIVGYSQLSRNLETRQDKRPLLHDLRESGGLEQDADVVIMLYRDKLYNPDTRDKEIMEMIIRKHREGETGVLRAKFLEETNQIIEEL